MVRRDCLLWVKGPADKVQKYDKGTLSRILWTSCKKSNERLRAPIVACEPGFMYNKEAMLMALLDRDAAENENIRHVHKLSDLTPLIFAKNPAWKEVAVGSESVDELLEQFVCPILPDATTDGTNRFAFYKKCGHVVSQQAIQTIGGTECLVCHQPACRMEDYDGGCENVILPLCPADAEEVRLVDEALAQRRRIRKERGAEAKGKAKPDTKRARKGEAADSEAAPAAKRAKGAFAVGVPEDLPLPSHHRVPKGATPAVWQSLFGDPAAPKPKEGFLVRSGMFGGGGGRNI